MPPGNLGQKYYSYKTVVLVKRGVEPNEIGGVRVRDRCIHGA